MISVDDFRNRIVDMIGDILPEEELRAFLSVLNEDNIERIIRYLLEAGRDELLRLIRSIFVEEDAVSENSEAETLRNGDSGVGSAEDDSEDQSESESESSRSSDSESSPDDDVVVVREIDFIKID